MEKTSATWLLIDISFLAYRSFYIYNKLEYVGNQTGVIYGVFKDILRLSEMYGTNNLVFCFDYGYKREEIDPNYKKPRKNRLLTPEEKKALDSFKYQLEQLRDEILPDIGMKNLCVEEGYEADDLIATSASVIRERKEHAIIISADRDLYQLLSNKISVQNPSKNKQAMTKELFQAQFFGLRPKQWAEVKAIAGCKSDNITGMRGVGEITAAKFLTNNLFDRRMTSKINDWINSEQYATNLLLTTLPFEGCPVPVLKENSVDNEQWRKIAKKFGMKSILDKPKF